MVFVMNCTMINKYKMVVQDFFNTLYNHKEIKALFICAMRSGVFRMNVKLILYSLPLHAICANKISFHGLL